MQVCFVFLMILVCSGSALPQVYLTKEAALDLYFPSASVERRTVFLTDDQVRTIQAMARAKVPSRIVTYYVGMQKAGTVGYAFFDTHVVRTMPETFMTVINPDGSIRAVEILAFYEPQDYLPPKGWLETFEGKSLQNDLWLKRGIHNIVGATISAQSITDAVRVTLALFHTVIAREQKP